MNDSRLDEALRALPKVTPDDGVVDATVSRALTDRAELEAYGRRVVTEQDHELTRSVSRATRSMQRGQRMSGLVGFLFVGAVYASFIGFVMVQFGRRPDPQPLELPARRLELSLATGPGGKRELQSALARGELPGRGAVDAHKLVNEFEYDYPAPEGGAALAMHVDVMRAPWNPTVRLVRVGVVSAPAMRARDVHVTIGRAGDPPHSRIVGELAAGAQSTELVELSTAGAELAHVEVRWTDAASGAPSVLSAVVKDAPAAQPSADQEWAAALAYFAQTLWRRAECGMEVALARAEALASRALQRTRDERRGPRAELAALIAKAAGLARARARPCD